VKVTVTVRPRAGILDPQGEAVQVLSNPLIEEFDVAAQEPVRL
jgi:phosphoribosylformylglycinamidine (FGAM) synthase PurS component